MHAGKRDRILRRLESDDTAVRSGPDHRPVGLRADRAGDLPRRDGRRRSRRRAARRVARVPRVSRLRRIEERERRRHRLAEHVAACTLQPLDALRVLFRPVPGVDRRAHLRGLVRGRDDVLHADADAVQRPAARARRGIAAIGFRAHLRRVEIRPRLDRGVGRADARELGVGERPRRQRALRESRPQPPSASSRATWIRSWLSFCLARRVGEKQRLQVVEKAPSQRRRPQQRRIALDQPARGGGLEPLPHQRQRIPRALGE